MFSEPCGTQHMQEEEIKIQMSNCSGLTITELWIL